MDGRRIGAWLLLGVTILTQTAAPARAGSIRGQVSVTSAVVRTTRKAGHFYGQRAAPLPSEPVGEGPTGEVGNVVVFIRERPAGSFPPPAQHPRMAQRNTSFQPKVLAVVVGTTVDFPNEDPLYHNVFSLSKNAQFDLGKFPRPQLKSHTFDQPGLVRVNCDIHAHMQGFVLVLPHGCFAMPSADGSYQIDGVPPGTYTLVAWHDALPTQVRTITVSDDAVTADFRL
jgi:plastocyanin